ncbi:MAG: PIN domain-containing protein [Treponemataceae bacterium]|nr:MAG: PIN domain-containing protein [Treponemataceae bacterium]
MRGLGLLIDCDVLIDFLTDREPFTSVAKRFIQRTQERGIDTYVAAHSITNIFYILRKVYSKDKMKQLLINLFNSISIVEINAVLINKVLLNNRFDDIEDCLQAECAVLVNADYIVTRNIKDYTHSAVPAILPEDFLKLQEA